MIERQQMLMKSIAIGTNGHPKLGEFQGIFINKKLGIEGIITALSTGGKTKRGRDPSGQTFDEAAQIKDSDYDDLDISSMAGDDHQIIGSTPYDDYGFFHGLWYTDEDDEDAEQYEKFWVPTAVLTDEGREILEEGKLRDLKIDHIKSVTGWKITKRKILGRLKKYDYITAKREIFGLFVSGAELFYPSTVVNPCIDTKSYSIEFNTENDILKSPEDIFREVEKRAPGFVRLVIGVDMAGKGTDKTAIVVFAIMPNGRHVQVYGTSWRRIKYPDQYRQVKFIADMFTSRKYGEPSVYVDSTGTQDSNVDSLVDLGLDVTGVDFQLNRKKNMAKVLFNLLINEHISLLWDEDMKKELLAVTADLKGIDKHLGDWVAAIWCAISEVQVIDEPSKTEYKDDLAYDGGAYLESVRSEDDWSDSVSDVEHYATS